MHSHLNHLIATEHDHEEISIRLAGEADRAALLLLAMLDSAAPLQGEILIARVGEKARAAMEVETGAVVADPFQRAAHVVELLKLRAAGLRRREDASARLPLRRRLLAGLARA
jgi:hypothetical protein